MLQDRFLNKVFPRMPCLAKDKRFRGSTANIKDIEWEVVEHNVDIDQSSRR